ncbi:MAG TPA: hypothetical protein VH816_10965 [Gaiellaceae bacterium]
MRSRRAAAVAAACLAACVATASVWAATVDRVKVGVGGRNTTRGLSSALYVAVPVVEDYTQSRFDGEQGDWQGPTYSSGQSSTPGRADLSFRSDFENKEFHVVSLAGMVQHALVHQSWTHAETHAVRVPRVLAGKAVGAIGGELAVYQEPISSSARWEAVLALPLCHGVFGAIDFYAGAPAADTTGTGGEYLVGTTPAKQWNHDHAVAAAQEVALDGPLPDAHVTAHRTAGRITGVVGDCGGGLRNVPVRLQRKAGAGWTAAGRGLSGAGGKFALPAAAAAGYRVVARLGPFSATATVR